MPDTETIGVRHQVRTASPPIPAREQVGDYQLKRWREDVLANPDGPDFERYLGRELSTTF